MSSTCCCRIATISRLTDGQGLGVLQGDYASWPRQRGLQGYRRRTGQGRGGCANPAKVKRSHGSDLPPRFLNRIDDIVVFHPLGMAQMRRCVDLQLADVRARLARRMTLPSPRRPSRCSPWAALDPVFGASPPLKRLVQRRSWMPSPPLSSAARLREGDRVTVDVDKDGGFTVVCDNTPAAALQVPDASRFLGDAPIYQSSPGYFKEPWSSGSAALSFDNR